MDYRNKIRCRAELLRVLSINCWLNFWDMCIALQNECELEVDCEGAEFQQTKWAEKFSILHQMSVFFNGKFSWHFDEMLSGRKESFNVRSITCFYKIYFLLFFSCLLKMLKVIVVNDLFFKISVGRGTLKWKPKNIFCQEIEPNIL